MKIIDYISKLIQETPLVFKGVNYDESKLKVLDHIFFTNGNGLKLNKYGYVSEKNKKANPYSVDTHKPLPNDYYESDIYYVSSFTSLKETIIIHNEYEDKAMFRYKKNLSKTHKPTLQIAENLRKFEPYPLSKDFCIFSDVHFDNKFIEKDWLDELVFLVKRTIQYYTNYEEYKNDFEFPTEKNILKDYEYFQKLPDKNAIIELRKTWSYENSDEYPTLEEVKNHIEKNWENDKNEKLEMLNKFYEKHI